MVSFNNCLQLIWLCGNLQGKVGEDSFKWVVEEPAEVWGMDCPGCPLVQVPCWLCVNKYEFKKPAWSAVRVKGTGHCILGYQRLCDYWSGVSGKKTWQKGAYWLEEAT